MLLFEAFFKFANIGVFLVLTALILKSKQRSPTITLLLLLFASFSCFLITSGHESLRINGPIALPLNLFDTLSIVCVWWLGLSLFDDEFRLRRFHWAFAVCYLLPMQFVRLHFRGFEFTWINDIEHVLIAVSSISLFMMTHLAWTALKGRAEDLVENRRKARVLISIGLVVIVCSTLLVERIASSTNWQYGFNIALYINYSLSLPLGIGGALWLMHFQPSALMFKKVVQTDTTLSALNPKDQIAHDKLIDLIETQRGFAEHGLTITKLAEKIGLPAHQLRPLINQTMGYSNFSSFLNHYRIEDVKHALSNPDLARTPILTLALEAGFSSLAPFNRAFKAELGVTPTEFRNQILGKVTNKAD